MLDIRFQEHTDGKHPNSAIEEHTLSTSYHYTMDDTKILVKEDKWFPRKIQEALHIHKRFPALNRDHEIPPSYSNSCRMTLRSCDQATLPLKSPCDMDKTSGMFQPCFSEIY